MFIFALSSLLIAIRAMSLFAAVSAAPVNETDRFDGMSPEARSILARATPAAPHFVLYSDMWVSGQTRPPTSSQLAVSPRVSTYLSMIVWLTRISSQGVNTLYVLPNRSPVPLGYLYKRRRF